MAEDLGSPSTNWQGADYRARLALKTALDNGTKADDALAAAIAVNEIATDAQNAAEAAQSAASEALTHVQPPGLVAYLAAVPIVAGEQAITITGGIVAGDKRGGRFVKALRAGRTANLGTTFATDSTTDPTAVYLWERSFNGPTCARWWGDDAAAVNAAIAALPSPGGGHVLLDPGGDYTGSFVVPDGLINVFLEGPHGAYPGNPPVSLIGDLTVGDQVYSLRLAHLGFTSVAKGIIVPNGHTVSKIICDDVVFGSMTDKAIHVEAGALLICADFKGCSWYGCRSGFHSDFGAVANNVHFDRHCIFANPQSDAEHFIYVGGLVGDYTCTNISVEGLFEGGYDGTPCIPIEVGCVGLLDVSHLHIADYNPAWGTPLIRLNTDGAGAGASRAKIRGDLANARGPVVDVLGANTLEVSGILQAGGAYAPIEGLENVQCLISNGAQYVGGAQMKNPLKAHWLGDQDFGPIGNIQCIAGSLHVDGETFTLNDGATIKVFEFDLGGGGVTGGRVAIVYTGTETATQMRDLEISAINGAGLTIAASIGGTSRIKLYNSEGNPVNYVTLPDDTVANAGFVINGMTHVLPDNAPWVIDASVPVKLSVNRAITAAEHGSLFLVDKPADWLVVTLPLAAEVPRGARFAFKVIAANGVRIGRVSSDLIEGGAYFYLYHDPVTCAGDYAVFESTGDLGDNAKSNWVLVASSLNVKDGGTADCSAVAGDRGLLVSPTTGRQHISGKDVIGDRTKRSKLPAAATDLLLVDSTVYWIYLGQTACPTTYKFVEFMVTVAGVGAQTAEVCIATSTTGPNKANQTLTRVVADGTLDALTGTGIKRNTAAMAAAVASGLHVWAGIRTNMGTTQPTIEALARDKGEGFILATAGAGPLTGAGSTWTASIIAAATGPQAPDLSGTLD
jgi:hypothetical protein